MTIHQPGAGLRILHVFRAPVGGLFRHVLDLTRIQVARGYDVGLFCDSTTGNAVTEAALAELAPSLTLGLLRTPIARDPRLGDLAVLARLGRALAKTQATVLHGHGAKGGAYVRLVPLGRRAGRVARVYTPHGGSFNYAPGTLVHRAYMAAERLMARRTELFTFESGFIADRFRASVGGADERVRVIYNGLADAEFEPIDPARAEFDLVYIGEMREAKGVDTLLDALSRLRRTAGRRVTLLAVGSGPDLERLEARARDGGVSDAIAFEPPQPIRRVLGRGRVMVVASRAESLPYVVLEAAAARQPLVSTNVGGIPEIFGPYADELIPPDDHAVLADAILAKLDEDPARRAERARALADHVRGRFSLAAMADAVIAGYVGAFADGPASAPESLALQSP